MEEEKKDELEEKREEAQEEKEKHEKIIEQKPRHEQKQRVVDGKKLSVERKKPSYNKEELLETVRGNPWVVSTFVLGAIVLIVLIGNFNLTGGVIGANIAGEKLLEFYESTGTEGLSLDSVETENGLYKVNFNYQGGIVPMYMTKDGKLAGNLNPIDFEEELGPQDVSKSDKPIVELFIMTHCPYGTQAEKGIIPAIEALGDNIDAKIRFVHYFMHEPEETETPRQICIREEQGEKFNDYLKEFLKEGDSDAALIAVSIDKSKLDSCVANKADSYYVADSALSNGYGVGGSPTLVINGQIVDSGRSADAYLNIICSAFNNAPEECTTLELDSASPSPGFGYGTSSGVATAQC